MMSPQSRGSGHPTHASQVPKWILAGHLSDESLKQEDGVSSHGSLRGGLRGSGMRSRRLGYGYGGSEIVFCLSHNISGQHIGQNSFKKLWLGQSNSSKLSSTVRTSALASISARNAALAK